MTRDQLGKDILRLGLAAMFLWFGFNQLLDGINWVVWVPVWAVSILHIPPAIIVLLNGVVEVVGGALLALNFFVRPVAAILAVHLGIIIFDIGLTAIGVRDFAIMTATLALAFFGSDERSLGA